MNHPGVTFSEFLESPIQERPYELGPVATSVGDEGLVSMGGGRGPDGSVIMPGTKEMPHG